jgi:hypothetical protein
MFGRNHGERGHQTPGSIARHGKPGGHGDTFRSGFADHRHTVPTRNNNALRPGRRNNAQDDKHRGGWF